MASERVSCTEASGADGMVGRDKVTLELAGLNANTAGKAGESPGLLVEMPDVSITLLGGLVGRPSCRTRPADPGSDWDCNAENRFSVT